MLTRFTAAMKKLSLLGQDITELDDCSDIIPTPVALPGSSNGDAVYPAGKSIDDVQDSVSPLIYRRATATYAYLS